MNVRSKIKKLPKVMKFSRFSVISRIRPLSALRTRKRLFLSTLGEWHPLGAAGNHLLPEWFASGDMSRKPGKCGDQMFRFRNVLLSSVFSTVVWATGTSQTARTAKPPAAKTNARKTREVRSFDMCAFFFFSARCCCLEYASNVFVFSTYLAVFGSGFSFSCCRPFILKTSVSTRPR